MYATLDCNLERCKGVTSSGAAYPELNASHGRCLPYFYEGRAVSSADGIDADAGGPGTAQGSAIRPKIGVDEFGIVLLEIQLLEGLGLQLIACGGLSSSHVGVFMLLAGL